MNFSQKIKYYSKNLIGWKTKRKIVAFSVDDYGNIRVASKKARKNMDLDGLKVASRFDAFDTLETEEDLQLLYGVLQSVKDKNGNHAVLTAFAHPANINFEKMEENNFQNYVYELLPETFNKLPGYGNVYDLWKQGIKDNIFIPEFHGREHINIKMLLYLLKQKDKEVMSCFKNRSYTSISSQPFQHISYPAAFAFEEFQENDSLKIIIEDGLKFFEQVFGYKALHFTSPTMNEHTTLHHILKNCGVEYIDAPLIKVEHQGNGNFKKSFHYTGKPTKSKQLNVVRNCVFEPSFNNNIEWADFCMEQIVCAFNLNRPANISSHRVNFCGLIDPENRKTGLTALRKLLNQITKKWPDVEFMSTREMMQALIQENKK